MVLTAEKAIRKHTEFKQMEAIRILPLRIEFRAKGCLPSRRETLNSISSIEEGGGREVGQRSQEQATEKGKWGEGRKQRTGSQRYSRALEIWTQNSGIILSVMGIQRRVLAR